MRYGSECTSISNLEANPYFCIPSLAGTVLSAVSHCSHCSPTSRARIRLRRASVQSTVNDIQRRPRNAPYHHYGRCFSFGLHPSLPSIAAHRCRRSIQANDIPTPSLSTMILSPLARAVRRHHRQLYQRRSFSASSQRPADFTHAVVGAGAVGLAIARRLQQVEGASVVLIERHGMVGSETSSRNSEVGSQLPIEQIEVMEY